MILSEAILNLVGDIVDLIVGVDGFSIFAKQDTTNPRPQGSYADLDLVSDTSIGWEERNQVDNVSDDDITETLQGAREIMVSIGFYRDGSMDNARKVRTAFNRESVLGMLRAADMGLVSRSVVRDISEVLESNWERRAQLDVTLSAVGTDEDIINSILSVSIEGEFQTSGGSIPITAEVNT